MGSCLSCLQENVISSPGNTRSRALDPDFDSNSIDFSSLFGFLQTDRGTRNVNNNSIRTHTENENNEAVARVRQQLLDMEALFNRLLQTVGQGTDANFHGFPGVAFRQNQQVPPEQRPAPPASKRALRQIPTIVVTPDDLIDESNRECCICLEENKLGDKVARLPCGHLFHRPCISDWLEKHNTCCICRYELETDDREFEQGRKERMSKRKQRFRQYELKRMSVRDLKLLASQLNINSIDITEKGELIKRIIESGKIDVVASAEPVEYKLSDLRSMGVGKLKKAMSNGGVFFDPVDVVEKEDMVQIFLNSGRLVALPEDDEEEQAMDVLEQNAKEEETISSDNMDVDSSNHSHMDERNFEQDFDAPEPSSSTQPSRTTTANAAASTGQDSISEEPRPTTSSRTDYFNSQTNRYTTNTSQTSFSSYSISQLKSFARELNVNVNDCVEKQEMIQRIVEAVERSGAPPRQRRRL